MSEIVEQMEHAAKGGHGHGSKLGMYVGLTIAFLGVLLALSSALVGGERTELIATMVEQTNTTTKYQALSTKYRVLLAQLRQLHSLQPNPAVFGKWEEESRKLAASLGSTDAAKLARLIRLENAKNLNAEIPTREDMKSFATIIKSVEHEQEAALEWTDSFEPAVQAHSKAAEHYEWGLLAAEIGVVVASLALLFSSRTAWYGALILVLATMLILGTTFIGISAQMRQAEESIHHAHAQFEAASDQKKGKAADEELLNDVEKEDPPVIDPGIDSGRQPAERGR